MMRARLHELQDQRRWASRGLLSLLLLLGAGGTLVALPRCSNQVALLLSVRATALIETIDIRIKDVETKQVVLELLGERVDPTDPDRDISKQPLKLAIEFDKPGTYLVHLLGHQRRAAGETVEKRHVFLRDFFVDSAREEGALLVLIPDGADQDGDGYPACGAAGIDCNQLTCRYLDCDDSNANVSPVAKEICGNGLDEDCSAGCGAAPGKGDEPCEDKDGDGDPASTDCDDNDPCRSSKLKEAANICQVSATSTDWDLPEACKKKLAAEGKAPSPPYCGDGIDQDCNGADVTCQVDEDCDGFSPPKDCDDKDPNVKPTATELCDGKDNNCDSQIDEGCIPCDVDGDGHGRPGSTDPKCLAMKIPLDDTDDYDAGINSDTTKGGAEGGTIQGALRELCSSEVSKDKNGHAPREVDHDGDGKAAKDDGCPTLECDKDGDGFQGSQCNPPMAALDCDDNDLKTFPGAPDYCGDGKAQNCVSDGACSCDKDGDHYCPPTCSDGACAGDCNDNDPNVHPWAGDKCNGADDDCDGLVDEGNPDGQGKLMPTEGASKQTCTNDNDGFCARQRGLCACSKQDPGTVRDEVNRVKCPDESIKADSSSPRCFGANQAEAVERCEPGDFNCDGHDVRKGEAFAGKGSQRCSVDVGECKSGVVIDCDLNQSLPYLSLIQAVQPEFKSYWVCGGKLPTPEVCDGRDGDCNGAVPATERDNDQDKYLVCGQPCSNFATGILGCGDCNDQNAEIHPNAPEKCNGTDDNCSNGTTDDGDNDCPDGRNGCCGAAGCKDKGSDFYNCNGCGIQCPSDTSSQCVNRQCVCGSSGAACPSGLTCVGSGASATCQCIPGPRCTGCCDGNTCRPLGSQPNDKCGTGGSSCISCSDGNDCTTDTCNAQGKCAHSNVGNGTSCEGGSGQCQNGACCKGCRSGNVSCLPGDQVSACGLGGKLCSSCSTTSPCLTSICSSGSCSTTSRPDGSSCSNGLCYSGSCCTGCWTGGSCDSGNTAASCGRGGASCKSCSDGNACTDDNCLSTGVCSNPYNTASCTSGGNNGKCSQGSCCTGCLSGTTCESGLASDQCGSGGTSCKSCSDGNACTDDNCSASGTCSNPYNTASCTSGGKNGTCNQGSCCTGCLNGTTCIPSPSASNCGAGGGACSPCGTPPECQKYVCSSTGTCTLEDDDSASCSGGTCHDGSCCQGCWTGSSCEPGDANDACGDGGESCTDCSSMSQSCNSLRQCELL